MSPAEKVDVDEKGAARYNLRLVLATRKKPTRRLLRHRPHSANRHHGRGAHQDTTDSRYRGGTGLIAKGKRPGNVMRQNSDSNRL